jgi:hypothetical protein
LGAPLQNKMTRLEKINLFIAIVGLLADVVTILSFVSGVFSFNSTPSTNSKAESLKIIFISGSGLIIIYGWITLAWLYTKRSLAKWIGERKNPRKQTISNTLFTFTLNATIGTGLLLSPLYLGWLILATSAMGEGAFLLIFPFGIPMLPLFLFVGVMVVIYSLMSLTHGLEGIATEK